ncbi:MAG TPA: hypothetical protein VMN39_01045, partial [Longimicrobiaceae bacterium]|nr:hypothetical protein [Longimicrobiaceae bacterium]
MRRRDRLLAVVALLAVLALAKIGQQAYRWHVYAPERAEIGRQETALEEAGLGVVRTQVDADSLLATLEALDLELRDARGNLDMLEREAVDRRARGSISGYYRAFEAYNRRVGERNELFARWRETLEENRQFVD